VSWVNDLASGLGIPAGAATLAVAMYGACVAAENAARPEALKDIGRILKDPSWPRAEQPSAIIQRMFVWTFGERHLSWRCVERSATASLLLLLYLGLVYHALFGGEFGPAISLRMALFGSALPSGLQALMPTALQALLQISTGFILIALLPDYLALAKARVLINCMRSDFSISAIALLVATDLPHQSSYRLHLLQPFSSAPNFYSYNTPIASPV
jgi:hypothetical protein